MNIDDVMPWIVGPLVLLFIIRSMFKKKGRGSNHDYMHDNLHDDHDFDSGDSGGDDD